MDMNKLNPWTTIIHYGKLRQNKSVFRTCIAPTKIVNIVALTRAQFYIWISPKSARTFKENSLITWLAAYNCDVSFAPIHNSPTGTKIPYPAQHSKAVGLDEWEDTEMFCPDLHPFKALFYHNRSVTRLLLFQERKKICSVLSHFNCSLPTAVPLPKLREELEIASHILIVTNPLKYLAAYLSGGDAWFVLLNKWTLFGQLNHTLWTSTNIYWIVMGINRWHVAIFAPLMPRCLDIFSPPAYTAMHL